MWMRWGACTPPSAAQAQARAWARAARSRASLSGSLPVAVAHPREGGRRHRADVPSGIHTPTATQQRRREQPLGQCGNRSRDHGKTPGAGRPHPRLVTGIAHAPTGGDPALVERLIANLLDNAVRYKVPGARVEISTRVEGDKAIASIATTAPVIPPAQVRRLLQPFQRLPRPRRRPPPPRTVHRLRQRHHRRRHAHPERAAAGRRPDRDPVPAHTVRNATAGGIRDARTAGIRPANAPIRTAEAMPPDHASTGITTAQLFELAYTAVAAAPASPPTTPPMTASRIDSARNCVRIWPFVAPRARRRPISERRSRTEMIMMLAPPTAPTISATSPSPRKRLLNAPAAAARAVSTSDGWLTFTS